jgi:hypothetical protein
MKPADRAGNDEALDLGRAFDQPPSDFRAESSAI